MLNRRSVLTLFPLTAVGILAACATTTSGGVTTVKINTAEIDSYGKVVVNAVSTVLSISAVSTALGAPTVALIEVAAAAVKASLTAFDTATSGSVTFTVDNTSALTAAKTVLADMSTVFTDLSNSYSALSGKIGTNDLANIKTIVSAVETAIALVEALLSSVALTPKTAQARMEKPAMFVAVKMTVPAWAK